MKTYLLSLLVLVLMASMTVAASSDSTITTNCQSQCCKEFDGTWSDDYCSSPTSWTSYSSCVSTCEQVASGKLGCCGGSAILMVLGAVLFIRNR